MTRIYENGYFFNLYKKKKNKKKREKIYGKEHNSKMENFSFPVTNVLVVLYWQ